MGFATIVSKEQPKSLTQVSGRLNLPFDGKQLNLSVRDWSSQRQSVALLTDENGAFEVDGVSVGQWLYLVVEGKVADTDKIAVFAAVVNPVQPLTKVEISLESTAFAAVLLSLQTRSSDLLAQPDLARLSSQVAQLTAFVLAEMHKAPGQPLLAYVTTPAFESHWQAWQETFTNGK